MKLLITGKTLGGGLILNTPTRMNFELDERTNCFLRCMFVDFHVKLLFLLSVVLVARREYSFIFLI